MCYRRRRACVLTQLKYRNTMGRRDGLEDKDDVERMEEIFRGHIAVYGSSAGVCFILVDRGREASDDEFHCFEHSSALERRRTCRYSICCVNRAIGCVRRKRGQACEAGL